MLGWASTIVRLPSPKPGLANRVGRTGFFFVPRALPLFDTNFIAGKNTLTATIVVIDIDKAQVNQRKEEIRFNYKFSFL